MRTIRLLQSLVPICRESYRGRGGGRRGRGRGPGRGRSHIERHQGRSMGEENVPQHMNGFCVPAAHPNRSSYSTGPLQVWPSVYHTNAHYDTMKYDVNCIRCSQIWAWKTLLPFALCTAVRASVWFKIYTTLARPLFTVSCHNSLLQEAVKINLPPLQAEVQSFQPGLSFLVGGGFSLQPTSLMTPAQASEQHFAMPATLEFTPATQLPEERPGNRNRPQRDRHNRGPQKPRESGDLDIGIQDHTSSSCRGKTRPIWSRMETTNSITRLPSSLIHYAQQSLFG